MNDTLFTLGVGTAMTGGCCIGSTLAANSDSWDEYTSKDELEYATIGSTFASPVVSTYYAQDLDINIKSKDSMAYIESMSREELVAFKNELSKIEKNMELEEQIDELLDESDNIRRI